MTRPELLAFDLMDTVVVDPFLPTLASLGGGDAEALRESLEPSAWIDFELGRIEEPTFLARIFRRAPPAGVTARRLADGILGSYAYVEGMEPLLEELRAAGARLWVLSNYPLWADRLRAQLALDRFFDGYAVSFRTGARKPDPAAYHELSRLSGVAPERCLLVDDRPSNLDGARRVGMPAVGFTGPGALRRELVIRGLLG